MYSHTEFLLYMVAEKNKNCHPRQYPTLVVPDHALWAIHHGRRHSVYSRPLTLCGLVARMTVSTVQLVIIKSLPVCCIHHKFS